MPWWGWALIVLAIIVTPLKLKILKKLMTKKSVPEEDM